MALFESMFDLFYLVCVVGLGIRLLLQKERSAKLFGAMAVLLGFGDAFHLIPRVISHWHSNGFVVYGAALSWGEAITSVTMTLFYLLYYYYYRRQTGDQCKTKAYLVYLLVGVRILLSILPQNQWGQMPGNYTWSLLRNIPFAALGILLIWWSYRKKDKPGMKGMALWISLSFLFYAPVVLAARFIPALGSLMIPKTVAYVMMILTGYRHFIREFHLKTILEMAYVNLILGLSGGVFYREFTKLFGYTDNTFLGKIHVHVLVLGFICLLIVYLLAVQRQTLLSLKQLKRAVFIWNSGLLVTVVFLWLHGIIEVTGAYYGKIPKAAISGLAGIGHIILAIGLASTMLCFLKAEPKTVDN